MAAKYQMKRPASARELAERFKVSERTVRRVQAQPRAEWLAEHSTEREKPWLRLGMSRATWYRHGKPDPNSVLAPQSGYDD
jgi:hypothetical protein